MNEDLDNIGNALPFAKPARTERGGGDGADAMGEEREALLEIVRQQPEINIRRTLLLHGKVGSGRYRVNASRMADKLLDFEGKLQRVQDSGGRNSCSNGKSSTTSTSHKGSST